MNSVGNLAEEALKRKERLKSLRTKQSKENDNEPPGKKHATGESLPKPVFRSYKPTDENLKEAVLPKAKPAEVKEIVKDQLDSSVAEPIVDEIDLTTLAPRKPDWDLKRDVAKKLEKLERRTQRAIAELIRERLQESGEQDLGAAVSAAQIAARGDED